MSGVGSAFRGGAERRRLEAEVGWRRKEDSESKSCLGCGGMTSCPHGGFRMPVVSPTRWILIDESAAWRVRAQIRFHRYWATKSAHCRGLPTGVSLNQTAIARIVRRHTTGAIGNSAPRFRIAYRTMNSVVPK